MRHINLKQYFGCIFVSLAVVSSLSAETFFKSNFDDGVINSEGKWTWEAAYSPSNVFGMMAGKGDVYEVSSSISLNGGYSLRLDFSGRNGLCNSCGFDTYNASSSLPGTGSTSLIIDGANFSSIFPSSLRKVFNKDDRWAAWSVSEASGSQLSFGGGEPVSNAMGGSKLFKPGDEIKITKACGLDGVVGGDINRRSDCDLAINYLEGISSADFDFGKTLSKRFYLYIDQAAVLPNIGLKLGYNKFKNKTAIPVLDVDRDETLTVQTPSSNSRWAFPGFQFQRGRWYYLEETFVRETADGVADGIYKLYLSSVGENNSEPLVERIDVAYGAISAMSIIGNWQHTNDASGYVYIDSIEIADHYIGPVDYKAPSNPPPFESIRGTVIK